MGIAAIRGWELWSLPHRLIAVILSVDALAVIAGTLAIAGTGSPRHSVFLFLLLVVLAVGYTEALHRIERLRRRISGGSPHVNMTSVWTLASALVLPPRLICLLVLVIALHNEIRSGRRRLHRATFNAATMLLATLAAGTIGYAARSQLHAMGLDWRVFPVVVSAIAAYLIVETVLIGVAMYLADASISISAVVGGWEDNLLELATLCLGVLAGAALLHHPWLVLAVLPPMAVLQRSALVKELEIAASTDPKTGLLNAVAWQQVAVRELSRAARDEQSLSVLIIDMDHFKHVNDNHGHLVGDAALRAVATQIVSELRDYDTVGRFGGEEFVALLPDVGPEKAVNVAERLRASVRCLHAVRQADGEDADTQRLSASIGIACYPNHGDDLEELLHAADGALYLAKRGGRNRVELADASAPPRPSVVDIRPTIEERSA